jgi:antitoxin component of MazEF toxin-antitoxin module
MTYKLIKIGSSTGVIIPKKQLDEKAVSAGDEITLNFEPIKKTEKQNKHEKFMRDLEKFMDTYDQDLKNLAKR